MTIRRTFKAPIQLDETASEKILFLSRCLIRLWNMAQQQAEHWLATKEKAITAFSFNFWLTPARKQTVTLQDGTEVHLDRISSDIEREVLRKLAGSYQSFFALKKNRDFKAKKPGQKKEEWFQTLSWSSFRIKDGVLFVPGYNGERIALPLKTITAGQTSTGDYLEQKIAGKKVVFATLSRDKDGRFILSLVTAEPLPKAVESPKFFRAIDLGAGDIAVTDSDGSEYLIPTRRPDKFWMKKIEAVEARQTKRVKGSRGWRRLAEARRYMHRRSGEQKNSYQKKVADALVSGDVECIIVGKANTRLGLARAQDSTAAQRYGAQNTGYLFRQFLYLKNKAEERGVRFIAVPDPRRKGDLKNPDSKFQASRELLRQGLLQSGLPVPYPESFQRKWFRINFGQGEPKKVAS